MRAWKLCLVLMGKACAVAVEARPSVTSVLETATEAQKSLDIFANHGGWVNPEDLMSMPQCIAQQDQSAWLSSMTKCTSKICINHVGLICTRHQWLTQLSCLTIEFSPDIVRAYLPHCSRSVLAKAQLSTWIRNVIGRSWLADVGDTNGLQHLAPASLTEGYTLMDVTHKAPMCLMGSISASTQELFQHVLASCSFTDTSQHTGNAARPWEYSEHLGSMIVLDTVTAGYDLTRQNILYGEYFDRKCFCDSFTIDRETGSCLDSDNSALALTQQRLWMNATCGPMSLPTKWTDKIRTTKFDYIPIEHWRWPGCLADMPEQVTTLIDRCATDACEVDSNGYCNVKRTVERSCFCNAINYDTCGGSCHVFETRVDYVHWLHDLCGNVHNWHGLPEAWQRLAAPTKFDMIPWSWLRRSSTDDAEMDFHFAWEVAGLVLLNVASFLAIPISGALRKRSSLSEPMHSEHKLLAGLLTVALRIFPTLLNTAFVQQTIGYEEVPFLENLLLSYSMPRLTWLATLLVIVKTETVHAYSIPTVLAVEWVMQVLASYCMIKGVNYGFEHGFYRRGMEKLHSFIPAKIMYAAALLWAIVTIITIVLLIQALSKSFLPDKARNCDETTRQLERTKQDLVQNVIAVFNERWTDFEQNAGHFFTQRSVRLEETRMVDDLHSAAHHATYGTLPSAPITRYYATYGTLPTNPTPYPVYSTSQKLIFRLCSISIVSLLLLWVTQCFFWLGFLGLNVDEYYPPNYGFLTAMWVFSDLMSVVIWAL